MAKSSQYEEFEEEFEEESKSDGRGRRVKSASNKLERKTRSMGEMTTDLEDIYFEINASCLGPVEIAGQLLGITKNYIIFRHKKLYGSKLMVSYFPTKDVIKIQGGIGEPSALWVYREQRIASIKSGTVKQLKNGFIEITELNGDKTLINPHNNVSQFTIEITGEENKPKPKKPVRKREYEEYDEF